MYNSNYSNTIMCKIVYMYNAWKQNKKELPQYLCIVQSYIIDINTVRLLKVG